MQPAQLSLLPDQYPAPPPIAIAQFPADRVAEAISVLAGLIARTAAGSAPAGNGDGDE